MAHPRRALRNMADLLEWRSKPGRLLHAFGSTCTPMWSAADRGPPLRWIGDRPERCSGFERCHQHRAARALDDVRRHARLEAPTRSRAGPHDDDARAMVLCLLDDGANGTRSVVTTRSTGAGSSASTPRQLGRGAHAGVEPGAERSGLSAKSGNSTLDRQGSPFRDDAQFSERHRRDAASRQHRWSSERAPLAEARQAASAGHRLIPVDPIRIRQESGVSRGTGSDRNTSG
jgi:hypothetical protein